MGRLREPGIQRAPTSAKMRPIIAPSEMAVARSRKGKTDIQTAWKVAEHPPGVRSADIPAMDEACCAPGTPFAWAAEWSLASQFREGIGFLGYTYLAELAQRAEYRNLVETIAGEMTRKWIALQSTGDEDVSKEIKELTSYMEDMGVKEAFQKTSENDGYFGRGHIFIDLGDADRAELMTPIGNGHDNISASKVGKGSIRAFKPVEPVWCYPNQYNSTDPLSPNWYSPLSWGVMDKQVHRTRLLTFVGREMPDMLKPAYSFGGLSLSQMAKPYVDNWLRTRQSVADLIHSFTVWALGTDLSQLLQQDGDLLFKRMELFNNLRDNRGMFVFNKDAEDFKNISAPLGTLDALQAQTQEHLSSVSRIPLVKLMGIQPAGLNASSEGEVRTFYDTINSFQEKFFKRKLRVIIDFCQLSLWGRINPHITFRFEPLWALDEAAQAGVRKTDAETGTILINAGVLAPEEERTRIARDPETPYHGLDPDDMPEPPEDEGLGGLGGEGGDPADQDKGGGSENEPADPKNDPKEAAKDRVLPFDRADDDSTWHEGEHPRRQDGKFGEGGGGTKGGDPDKQKSESDKPNGETDKPKVSPKAKERISAAASWIKTAAVEKIFTGDNIKSAAAVAIKSTLYHGLSFDDAMMNIVEDYIHLQVKHVAETASVTRGVIREKALSVVNALIAARKGKPVAKDSDDGDPVLAVLEKMKEALENMAEDSAEFKEADHPRREDGKFGTGGGSGGEKGAGESKEGKKSDKIVFAAKLPNSKGAEVERDGDYHSEILDAPVMYDTSYNKDGSATVANIRVWLEPEYERDENGDLKENDDGEPIISPDSAVKEEGNYPASEYLDEDDLAALQAEITETERGNLEDRAEQKAEEDRWKALSPKQKAAETAAIQEKQDQEDREHTVYVNSKVDEALKSGWRPEFNKSGGWVRPPQLQELASPKSTIKVYEQLAARGVELPDIIKRQWLARDSAMRKRAIRGHRGVKA